MNQNQTIQVELTDRLVQELPRFFGGIEAAMRELFQNAYRAGAQHVNATLVGNVLTFEDDGRGCLDPQLLLSAGATGWDESKVVEPAGLGFFSLLSKDVASSVDVQSHGWRVTLLPQHVLAKKPVVVQPGEVTVGLRVRLTLVNEKLEHAFRQARAYYPYRVTYNGADVPVTAWNPHIVLETPVGTVGLRRRQHTSRNHIAIWEHRGIQHGAFDKALAQEGAGDDLWTVLHHDYDIHWKVDPAAGVTPKLPDRNDLLENAALHAAVRTILKAADEYFTKFAEAETRAWPRTLPEGLCEPEVLFRTQVGGVLLERLGWHDVRATEFEELNVYYESMDGFRRENGGLAWRSKDVIRVASQHLVESINNAVHRGYALPFAVLDTDDGVEAEVVGLKEAKTDGAWVNLAKEIRVGDHKLPFLLGSADNEEDATIVLATRKGDEAVEAITGGRVALGGHAPRLVEHLLKGFLASVEEDRFYNAWGDAGDDGGVHWDEVEADIVNQITKDFVGEALAKARSTLHLLRTHRSDLHEDVGARIRMLENDRLTKSLPETKAFAAAYRAMDKALDAKIKVAAKRAKLPE